MNKLPYILDVMHRRFGCSTNSTDYATESILLFSDELERNQIAENVKLGMTRRAFDGGWNGGLILGYDNVEDVVGNKVVRINLEEAALVRLIAQKSSAGKGYRAIANNLNRTGYKTKRGNAFSTIAVKDILLNQTYTGEIQYNKYEKWSDKRRKGLSENHLLVDGKHEAIVYELLWGKVQVKLKLNSKHPSWTKTGTSVQTGLIKCPECDSAMGHKQCLQYVKGWDQEEDPLL